MWYNKKDSVVELSINNKQKTMSAGQPNWNKLMEMGKLPKEARGKIPVLAQLDAAEAVIEEIKKGCCDDCRSKFFPGTDAAKKSEVVTVKCEVLNCEYIAQGKSEAIAKNNLRLHLKSHESKKNQGGDK